MRRATVTIPDDLETELDRFQSAQPAEVSLAALVQTALRRFLTDPDRPADLLRRVLHHRAEIVDLAHQHGVSSIRLFGSVARGEERPDSDLDFLVTVDPGRTLFDLARLRAALESALDAPVDLVSERNLTGDAHDDILAEAIEL